MLKSLGAGLAVSGMLLLAGCGGHEHMNHDAEELVTDAQLAAGLKAEGELIRYDNPYGDGRANPIPAGARAKVHSVRTSSGKTVVVLHVKGATPNRHFGSHVHVAACSQNKAGGHYQNVVAPAGQAANPLYANPENEVWLDLVTDAEGNGSAQAVVDFQFREDGANAIIIHDRHTDHSNGTAGSKLGCLDADF